MQQLQRIELRAGKKYRGNINSCNDVKVLQEF